MLLSKIIKNFEQDLEISNFKDLNIEGIQTDSRLIKSNNLFFAIKGSTINGVNFIDAAIQNGATAIVCSEDESYENPNLVVIKCKDVIKMLGQFLNIYYFEKPKHIIGITGTSGKTSVAEFTRQTIQKLGFDAASIGTLGVNFENSHLKDDTLTMRETVDLYQKLNFLKTEKNIDYVAMEFTSQGIHQKRAIDISIEIGVFNNITAEHLDYHKSMEEYFIQKSKIFTEILAEKGKAVLNADIPEYAKLVEICKQRKQSILSYGYNGDIKILNIKKQFAGQEINFKYENKEYILKTSFIGQFQAMNLLAVLAILILLDLKKSITELISVLETVKQARGRMEIAGVKKNGAQIYIDFAHKPDALKQVLETMREHILNDKEARIVILFGCGGDRDKTKRPIMGKIANDLADVVIITDDNCRTEDASIIRGEIAATCPKAYNIGGRKEAIEKAIDLLQPKDILILAGKGHENYTIIGKEKFPFDEFEIVENYLK